MLPDTTPMMIAPQPATTPKRVVSYHISGVISISLTCSRSNSNQASDHALHSTDNGWLLKEDDIHGSPHEQANRSRKVGV
jgi:hypothetical protein